MRVPPEHAVGFGEQLAEARVREDPEPVVARGLAVLQPRRRADGAVLLERFVGRIRDQQIDRFRGLVSQPATASKFESSNEGGGTGPRRSLMILVIVSAPSVTGSPSAAVGDILLPTADREGHGRGLARL